jgi:hypothetical protein
MAAASAQKEMRPRKMASARPLALEWGTWQSPLAKHPGGEAREIRNARQFLGLDAERAWR